MVRVTTSQQTTKQRRMNVRVKQQRNHQGGLNAYTALNSLQVPLIDGMDTSNCQ